MLPLLVPVVIAGVTGAAILKKLREPRDLTPNSLNATQAKVFDTALQTLKDPQKLRALADAFEKSGKTEEAALLRKRAGLRELPEDVKAARREAFRAAMNSQDAEKIEALAKVYHEEGATGAAQTLRTYAASLKVARG